MTSQKSISKNENMNGKSTVKKMFLHELRSGWPHLLLFALLSFLIPVLPLLLAYSSDSATSVYTVSRVLDDSEVSGALFAIVSILLGVYAGCVTMPFINSKQAVNFYHALPVKRSVLFLIHTLPKLTYYLISTALYLVMTMLVFTVFTACPGAALTVIMPYLLFGFACFMLIYAIGMVSAMLSGNGVVRFIGILYILFILFGLYMSVLLIFTNSISNVDMNYYYNTDIILALSPAIRMLFVLVGESFSYTVCFLHILFSLILFGAAILLYQHRRSESAGTPIVFKGAAAVIKYSVVFVCTVLAGEIFEVVGDGSAIVGLILGAMLSFMLMNVILTKNAREVFAGLKNLGIYAAAFAVVYLFVGVDVTGKLNDVPDPDSIGQVRITINNDEYYFRDDAVIEAMCEMLEMNKVNPSDYGYADLGFTTEAIAVEIEEFDNGIYNAAVDMNNWYMDYVLYPKFGIPVAKGQVINKEVNVEFIKLLADSEEYEAQLLKKISAPMDELLLRATFPDSGVWVSESLSGIRPYSYGEYIRLGSSSTRVEDIPHWSSFAETVILRKGYESTLPDALMKIYDGDVCFDSIQKPTVASMQYYHGDEYLRVALNPDDLWFLKDVLKDADGKYSYKYHNFYHSINAVEDYYDAYADHVKRITVYDADGKKIMETEDREEIRDLSSRVTNWRHHSNYSTLMVASSKYIVTMMVDEDYYYYFEQESYENNGGMKYADGYTYITSFLYGMEPDLE